MNKIAARSLKTAAEVLSPSLYKDLVKRQDQIDALRAASDGDPNLKFVLSNLEKMTLGMKKLADHLKTMK